MINRYNGHTWIVAIVAMSFVALLTLGAFALLGYVITITENDTQKTYELLGGIAGILVGAYKAMEQVFTHLTKPIKKEQR